MNIQQAKYHLKRIQTILDLQDKDLSPLDRDILLEDLRKLYELILYSSQSGIQSSPAMEQPPKSVEYADKESVFTENRSEEIPVSEPVKSPPTPSEERYTHEERPSQETDTIPAESRSQEEKEIEEPPHSDIVSSGLSTERLYEEPIKEAEKENAYIEHSSQPVLHSSTDIHSTKANGQDGETTVIEDKEDINLYPELFDFQSTKDLSEKLGNSKVEHLNRILAINDKILYINHLYGGGAIPFQESLKKFESFYTYEEAKSYATRELVEQYDWTERDKTSTVQQFMRQVKRLYS